MKKYFQILIVILLLVTSILTQAQSEEFAVPLSDPAKRGKLKAHLNSGSISVKGTARKDVLVKYSVMDSNDDEGEEQDEEEETEEIEEHGNKHNTTNKTQGPQEKPKSKAGLKRIGGGGIDLEITENANQIKVESGSWNQELKLEIEVPSGFDLQLHTYNNGDLMISNIQGALELTNYNGEITALNISGSVVANTYNGEIRVTFDKVTPDTPMSYSTYNGDLDITFPAALKANVKVKTEQGSIYSDFDNMVLKSSGPVQKSETKGGVYKVVVDEWKVGTINGGGAEITMRNYHGDVILRKK